MRNTSAARDGPERRFSSVAISSALAPNSVDPLPPYRRYTGRHQSEGAVQELAGCGGDADAHRSCL